MEQPKREAPLQAQTSIDEETWDNETEEIYGVTINLKEENTTRVMFMNVGGVPLLTWHQKKRNMISIMQKKVDIFGLVEVNVKWKEIP